eukprot:403342653
MLQRDQAARIIQKNFKRYVTQQIYSRVVEFERNYLSLKWTSRSPQPHHVQVVGSFTNPPWEKKVELDYCPIRCIFVKYMSNLTEGTHLIKFIVDGQFQCNPAFPVTTDSTGHLNNILEIVSGDQYSFRSGSQQQSIASSVKEGLMRESSTAQRSQISREALGSKGSKILKFKQQHSQGFNPLMPQAQKYFQQFDLGSQRSSQKGYNHNLKTDKHYHLEDFEEYKSPVFEKSLRANLNSGFNFNKMSPIPSIPREYQEAQQVQDLLNEPEFDRISFDNPPSLYQDSAKKVDQSSKRSREELKLKSGNAKNKLLTYEDFYEEDPPQTMNKDYFNMYGASTGMNEDNNYFDEFQQQNTQQNYPMMGGMDYDDYYAQNYYQDNQLASTQLSYGTQGLNQQINNIGNDEFQEQVQHQFGNYDIIFEQQNDKELQEQEFIQNNQEIVRHNAKAVKKTSS